MANPEFLEVDVDLPSGRRRVRVEREVAEDDLGVERIDGEQLAEWVQANLGRIGRAALAKILTRAARPVGDNSPTVIGPGDLID